MYTVPHNDSVFMNSPVTLLSFQVGFIEPVLQKRMTKMAHLRSDPPTGHKLLLPSNAGVQHDMASFILSVIMHYALTSIIQPRVQYFTSHTIKK